MSDPSAPPPEGKSAFSSKTLLSLAGVLITFYLPSILAAVGIPQDQQGPFVAALNQIGPPLGVILAGFFRVISKKPITGVVKANPNLLVLLALGLVLAASGPGLSACATKPLAPPSLQLTLAQGDTSLDAAFNVVAKYYLTHVPTDPAVKARAKRLLLQALAAVQAADAAETLGRADTVTAQVKAATSLLTQARALLGMPGAAGGSPP
jgi:hypothetical protein